MRTFKPWHRQPKWNYDPKSTRVTRKALDILRDAEEAILNHLSAWDGPIDLSDSGYESTQIIKAARARVEAADDAAQKRAKEMAQ